MTTEDTGTTSTADTSASTAAPRAVDWDNQRVRAILQAAAKCFARKGFSATTLAEIGKELGLRKSIVHYYFASKAALIHEVQSFTYHQFLRQVREALQTAEGQPVDRALGAFRALWTVMKADKTGTGLSIEVWSAARRDPELKRRATALQRDSMTMIAGGIAEVLGVDPKSPQLLTITSLVIATMNGLAVTENSATEGEGEAAPVDPSDVNADAAFEMLLRQVRPGLEALANAPAAAGPGPVAVVPPPGAGATANSGS